MTLQNALSQIEDAGSEFNKHRKDGENFHKDFKEDAYTVILKYIIDNDILLIEGFENMATTYQKGTFAGVQKEIYRLHQSIYDPATESFKKIPLELFLLFKTIDTAFCSPDNFQKKLYVDMDNVLVDFPSAFKHFDADILAKYEDRADEIDGIFSKMEPVKDAIGSAELLFRYFDLYILSTAPWRNPSAWSDKLKWVQNYLPVVGYKRLIISHHKELNDGDYLVDDRIKNGVLQFKGEHIHFGTERFHDWKSVTGYLLDNIPPG